jgi:uncharacterized membrane protein
MTPKADMPPDATPPAARVDRWMTPLLRTTSGLSVALIGLGIAVSLCRHPQYVTSRAPLSGLIAVDAKFPHSLATVLVGVAAGQGQAMMLLGLLMLIVTPILRVGLSALGFLELRDWPFAAISALLVAILLVSLALGSAW